MKITRRTLPIEKPITYFRDLQPGDVFVRGDGPDSELFMCITSTNAHVSYSNVVRLTTGGAFVMADSVEVTRLEAELVVTFRV